MRTEHIAAQVALKMRDDYGINWNDLPQPWAADFLHDACVDNWSVASITFALVNHHQARRYNINPLGLAQ